MKKAFTMIELVFVIVILGILAAVAVPKLTATRDDAQFAQIVSNTKTVIKDIITYYIAYGQFPNTANSLQDMTNVKLNGTNTGNKPWPNQGYIAYNGQECIKFNLSADNENLSADLERDYADNGGITRGTGNNGTDRYSSSAFFRVYAPENNNECKKILQMATGLQGNKRMKYYNLI